MKNYLLLTALFSDYTFISELYKTVLECRCNVHESRMTTYHSEYTASLSLSGTWDAIAKVENAIAALKNKFPVTIIFNRSIPRDYGPNFLSYSVQAVTPDKPGVLFHLTRFFIDNNITIHEVYSTTYETSLTKTPMGMLTIAILIPISSSLSQLRENFMVYCDGLNVDAVIEPDKV